MDNRISGFGSAEKDDFRRGYRISEQVVVLCNYRAMSTVDWDISAGRMQQPGSLQRGPIVRLRSGFFFL